MTLSRTNWWHALLRNRLNGRRAVLFIALTAGMLFFSPAQLGAQATDATEAIEATASDQAVELLRNLAFPANVQVAYEETQMNSMLKTPTAQQGYVEITEQGAFVMQVIKPRLEQRRLEGGKLSLKRPSRAALRLNPKTAMANARTRTLKLNPEHGGHLVLLAITQVLKGNIAELTKHFALQGEPGATWRVILTPVSPKVQKRLAHIELTGNGSHLLGLLTQRSDTAWQQLTFKPSGS